MAENVEENIKKARRSAYSIFGSGFHGYNGLDVDTMTHLYKIYIIPVLLYGMELILPTSTYLLQLENFQKKMLKQIMSLPQNVADAAVYTLTGILPIEAQIHTRALCLFNNICRQKEDSIEKSLARRQLTLKNDNSSSWFIAIKFILRQYDLQEAILCLDNFVNKTTWSSIVKRSVSNYWYIKIVKMLPLYSGLDYLSSDNLAKGKIHPMFKVGCYSPLDVSKLPVKLKLLTGSYILQNKRVKMYRDEEDPTCLLCGKDDETPEHFILTCEKLEAKRTPVIYELCTKLAQEGMMFEDLGTSEKMQIILDVTRVAERNRIPPASVVAIERITRRLLNVLHITRYNELCKN